MKKSIVNLPVCLLLIVFAGLGCGLVKNPLRDYSAKPFNSAEWLAGDPVERGRMCIDLFKSRTLSGKTQEDVTKQLGEPDKKQKVEGREVWLYEVEFAYRTPMKYFPVSFEPKGGAFTGRIKGSTMSMLVED
jgi:hypothetical protein